LKPGRAPTADAVLLVATLWTWGVTAAAGWQLAGRHGAVLPLLPTLVWCAPGLLWQHVPLAAVAALAAATLLAARSPVLAGRWRLAVVIALGLVVMVALGWGGALLGLGPGPAAAR
jgi:hypothetical protein